MNRSQVRFALLRMVLITLGLSTWVFTSFILETRPESTASDPLSSLARLPASLPTQLTPTTIPLPPIEMNSMDFSCWDKTETTAQETTARWIRLTGKACLKELTQDVVQVENQSNGYVATVFSQDKAALTTDFIPLNSGLNEILIRYESEPGVHVENKLRVMRQ